jgi:ribosomal protein L3 glutamine methyltransferase
MNTRFQDFLNEMDWQNYRVLDLCTGSGCIGISLALMHPLIHVDLADISAQALAVAEKNIQKYALSERVKCIQSNVFENISERYDLIITNPPYVSATDYKRSAKEFKNEPKIALVSGRDGLDIVHQIMQQARNYLNPNGKLIAEVGMPAVKQIKKHYRRVPFKWYKYRTPAGKVSWFISPGVFEVSAQALQKLIIK